MNFLQSLLNNHARAKYHVIAAFTIVTGACVSNDKNSHELFNPSDNEEMLISSSDGVSWLINNKVLIVNFLPGKYNAAIEIRPSAGSWDASAYRFVRCELENPNQEAQIVELGFGDYDLTLGGTLVPPKGKKIGFNTIGNWSDSEIYLKRQTPYVLTINSLKTGLIADPYP
jgi:hypothetical protein